MENYPNHSRNDLRNRETEALATRQIDRALETLEPNFPLIDSSTARTIAATAHAGMGTVLEHFAATGRIDAYRALDEISEAIVCGLNPTWAAALAFYIENLLLPDPDHAPLRALEPAPEVYLESSREFAGGWTILRTSLDRLDGASTPFGWWPNDGLGLPLDLHAVEVSVRNAVGFHGLDVRGIITLEKLQSLSDDIAIHGEALASCAAALEISRPTGALFKRRFVGSFDSMTDFLAAVAEQRGLLDRSVRGDEKVRGPTVNLDRLRRGLEHLYAWHQGPTQLHVFARAPRIARLSHLNP